MYIKTISVFELVKWECNVFRRRNINPFIREWWNIVGCVCVYVWNGEKETFPGWICMIIAKSWCAGLLGKMEWGFEGRGGFETGTCCTRVYVWRACASLAAPLSFSHVCWTTARTIDIQLICEKHQGSASAWLCTQTYRMFDMTKLMTKIYCLFLARKKIHPKHPF